MFKCYNIIHANYIFRWYVKKSWIWSGHLPQGRHHSWSWMSVDAPIVPWVVLPPEAARDSLLVDFQLPCQVG
jgi:hypothetical protein